MVESRHMHPLGSVWREVYRDLGLVDWARFFFCYLPIFIWTAALVLLLGVLICIKSFIGPFESACTPDGLFSLSPDHYSYWTPSGFFQMTLVFGEMVSIETTIWKVDVTLYIVLCRGKIHRCGLGCCKWYLFLRKFLLISHRCLVESVKLFLHCSVGTLLVFTQRCPWEPLRPPTNFIVPFFWRAVRLSDPP